MVIIFVLMELPLLASMGQRREKRYYLINTEIWEHASNTFRQFIVLTASQ